MSHILSLSFYFPQKPMSEYVNTYDLIQPYQVIPMERGAFYDEQVKIYKETGRPTKAIDIIDVVLFNESGEMIVQKRTSHKKHNPNLLDKSVGGHVQVGDDPNYTVMVETVQELEVPSLVTRNHTEFIKAYMLLDTYLKSVAIIEYVDTKTFEFKKIFDKEPIIISNRVHFYLGVYGGKLKNIDREARGVLLYSLEELEKEIKEFPAMFTDDLKVLLREYNKEIKEFIAHLAKK